MTNANEPTWGDILKFNSNGTYYGMSLEYVNRNHAGHVDFKMIDLNGIALVNIVPNTNGVSITRKKTLETRIARTDGL